MKQLFSSFCLAVAICIMTGLPACNSKDTVPNVGLSGQAYYNQLTTQGYDTLPLAVKDIQVLIVQSGTIYHLHTDTAGNFALPGLLSSDSLRISTTLVVNDTVNYHVAYKVDTVVTGNKISSLKIFAKLDTVNNTALRLVIADKNNGIIPGASILGYFSGEVASYDEGYDGFDANIKLTADINGQCLLMQLPSTDLYVRSQYKADTGKVLLRSGVDTIFLSKLTGKFIIDTIKLKE